MYFGPLSHATCPPSTCGTWPSNPYIRQQLWDFRFTVLVLNLATRYQLNHNYCSCLSLPRYNSSINVMEFLFVREISFVSSPHPRVCLLFLFYFLVRLHKTKPKMNTPPFFLLILFFRAIYKKKKPRSFLRKGRIHSLSKRKLPSHSLNRLLVSCMMEIKFSHPQFTEPTWNTWTLPKELIYWTADGSLCYK